MLQQSRKQTKRGDSVLLCLPYFDPTRMLVIHNLYLGTAKRMLSLWMERGIIVKQHYDKIQNTKFSGYNSECKRLIALITGEP